MSVYLYQDSIFGQHLCSFEYNSALFNTGCHNLEHLQHSKGYSTNSVLVLEIIASPLVSTKDEMT